MKIKIFLIFVFFYLFFILLKINYLIMIKENFKYFAPSIDLKF